MFFLHILAKDRNKIILPKPTKQHCKWLESIGHKLIGLGKLKGIHHKCICHYRASALHLQPLYNQDLKHINQLSNLLHVEFTIDAYLFQIMQKIIYLIL